MPLTRMFYLTEFGGNFVTLGKKKPMLMSGLQSYERIRREEISRTDGISLCALH